VKGSALGPSRGASADRPQRPLPGADAPLLDPEVARVLRENRAALRRSYIKSRSGIPLTAEDYEVRPLDKERIRNAIQIPDDAGELAPALEAMLRRVPGPWTRTVGCDRGWYPLVAKLDHDLAQLDPGYIVHQVKEKFGALRLYFEGAPEVAEEMQAVVDAAVEASRNICELCGAPGMFMEGWFRVKTLCPKCGIREGLLPVEFSPWAEEIEPVGW